MTYKAGQNEYVIECDTIASHVKVVNPAAYLTLCEVKVLGLPDPIDREFISAKSKDKYIMFHISNNLHQLFALISIFQSSP